MNTDRRFYQSKTGDVYSFRWNKDPRGMGGVWLERWLRRDDESGDDCLHRAMSEGSDADDWMGVPADICHNLADQLTKLCDERYEASR